MIENPLDWYNECGKYAIDNQYYSRYGVFFLIKEETPAIVKEKYRKYLDLCIKPFLSNEVHIFKDGHIVGFEPTDNPALQEQIDIFKQLVQKGYINNDVYPPKVIGLNRP